MRQASINDINSRYVNDRLSGHNQPSAFQTTTKTTTITPSLGHQAYQTTEVRVGNPNAIPFQDNPNRSVQPKTKSRIPWWCWLLGGLLLLALILSVLGYIFRDKLGFGKKTQAANAQKTGSQNGVIASKNPELSCSQGSFLRDGMCLTCPAGSSWNGENCIKSTASVNSGQQVAPPTHLQATASLSQTNNTVSTKRSVSKNTQGEQNNDEVQQEQPTDNSQEQGDMNGVEGQIGEDLNQQEPQYGHDGHDGHDGHHTRTRTRTRTIPFLPRYKSAREARKQH